MSPAATVRLTALRVEHLREPLAIASLEPRFSWALEADGDAPAAPEAYRIEVLQLDAQGRERTVADSGRLPRDGAGPVRVAGFTAEAGADHRWTLQVWLTGAEHPLVAQSTFGTAARGWEASWIEPEQQRVVLDGPVGLSPQAMAEGAPTAPIAERLHPPRHLRHRFHLDEAPLRARLRITSQGAHQPSLNGRPIGDGLLAPGYESYHEQISVMTHDITDQLVAGENVLGVVLGDGWYAGRISFLGRSAQYGDLLRASWQIELTTSQGEELILPDEQVRSARGPIDWSDLFIGERHDARAAIDGWDAPGFDDSAWSPSRTVPITVPLVPFAGEPVRRVVELPVREVLRTPAGDTLLDLGQVIAGRMRVRARGAAGTVIRLEHSEVLDRHGEFFDNIHGVNKDQVDELVLAGDPAGEEWEPLFAFHGFRYVRVIGWPGELRAENCTAVVIASDLETTAGFASSDPRLDQLFSNTLWSQRGNFLAVPTDCPQRERAGWTGDLQIFAPTAATLMHVPAFLERWLGNVRLDQRAAGGVVPNIVPEPPAMVDFDAGGLEFAEIEASAGWGDVITIAPWALYERYADPSFLRDNLAAMRGWVEHQTRDAAAELPVRLRGAELDAETAARHRLLWNGRMHFGDWLAPSTVSGYLDDPGAAIMVAPRTTSEFVGPLFQIRSLDLLARAADVLGEITVAEDARARAAAVRAAFAAEYVGADGALPVALQGPLVLALAFDAIPSDRIRGAVDRLVALIRDADDHLDTGFLSVPFLLDVLWDHGERDLARRLLLQDTAPSWLYEVARGATTIWETWRAVHEDGEVELASMNHYAFGCVIDFVMRRIAGIEPAAPGLAEVVLRPDLDGSLELCAAHVQATAGRVSLSWRLDGEAAELEAVLPPGVTARVELPDGWGGVPDALGAGRHRLRAERIR